MMQRTSPLRFTIAMTRKTVLTALFFAAGMLTWVLPHDAGANPATPATLATPATPVRVEESRDRDTAITPSIDQRYSDPKTEAVPDFQKHVTPLLGRLGCNGRACHGSFQGRGDFQLSLFGYDFAADHDALMAENTGRVDVDDVDESLILAKPSDADMHEGGKRFEKDKWQYNVLRNWIAGGAEFEKANTQKLARLEIQPAEIRFTKVGEDVQLKAIAHWEDGTVEDVTPLCRFSSNDDSIAAIDESGHIQSGDIGDTHVVVYYDISVVPIPVIQPLSNPSVSPGQSVATQSSDQPIDRLIAQKLEKIGAVPSDLCTDAEFIRRASLDITGVLPSANQVRHFLADASNDKRQRLVQELLDSPAYAAWWATRMSDWTGNNAEQLNNALPVRNVSTKLWFEWLRKRLADNVPYDKIIEGIVTAQSRGDGESYLEYCRDMTKACNGEPQRFANRDGMPLFWSRRNFQKPEDRAIGFAYTFLGVRIECAQCHKHPFDQWSKNDFDDFSKLFAPIRSGNANQVSPDSKKEFASLMKDITGGKKLKGGDLRRKIYEAAREGKVVPFGELYLTTRVVSDRMKKQRAIAKKKGRKLPPVRVPTGTILGLEDDLQLDQDPRPALMEWLRDESNPYFAKAIVNRVWSNYFGIGIVDPTDDMNLANPPSNAALLDHLAKGLIANEFNLKWLHNEICSSHAYQRSAETNSTNESDRKNFSHHLPRRMPAEVVFDMVALATGSTEKADELRTQVDQMAIAEANPRLRNQSNFALQVFGQSIRETNCDCDRSDDPSLLQSIYLRNDSEMYKRIADRNGWVAEACKQLGVAPPSSSTTAKEKAKFRAADAMRKQAIAKIGQFNKSPEKIQEKLRPRLEQQYTRVRKTLRANYQVPPLKKLLSDPSSWSELESVDLAKRTQTAESTDHKPVTLDGVVEEAYLRTLSRYPDDEERLIAFQYVEESETPAKGIEGLVWALVNTKEFIISH